MKIASLVSDLTVSQNSYYMIKNFNKLAYNPKHAPYVFYNDLSSMTIEPSFPVMNIYYINFFQRGKIICSDLKGLKILINAHSSAEKFFYVWDLEWLRGNTNYMSSVSMMNNERIKLLARSHEHTVAIQNYCNKEVHAIVDDWNYQDLEQI